MAGWIATDAIAPQRQVASPSMRPSIGGPFQLTSHTGKPVTEKDFRGKPLAIFFGFTFCPDVCPTTMNEMAELMSRLGTDAERMHWVFVSVDAERDTPAQMAEYVALFDKRIVGLSGTTSQIADVARAFQVYYRRVAKGDTVTYDHSASIFLLDANGQFAGTIDYKESPEVAFDKLRALVARAR
jgi:protein SCO1/2